MNIIDLLCVYMYISICGLGHLGAGYTMSGSGGTMKFTKVDWSGISPNQHYTSLVAKEYRWVPTHLNLYV